MNLTPKHNIRIPDEIWLPAVDRAEEIARLGIKGEHGAYSVADIVRTDMARCQTETLTETLRRLGLVTDAPAGDSATKPAGDLGA
jgi:hypothetical protein